MQPSAPPAMRYYRHILIGILLLAFGLRMYRLGYQSLRGDEGITYVYSLRPLAELFEIMRVTSPHPPVYYTSIRGWMTLAGNTEFALRFLSVVAGVLLVASMAAIGRMIWDARLGLLAAALVALNPYQIFYAQDARSYPLVTLLGVLSTISLWQALRTGAWRYWVAYGLTTLLGIYTHYYAFFIVVFQGLFVTWDWRRRRSFPWQYATIGLVVVVLFLPWISYSWGLLTGYRGMAETTGVVGSIWRPLMAFTGGQLLSSQFAWINAVAFLPLLVLGTVGLWQERRLAALLTVLYLTVPLIGVYVASRFRPIFNERYLMVASPAFYLLIAAALLWIIKSRKVWHTTIPLLLVMALLATGVLALSNHYFNSQFAKSPPWRDVMDYIADQARPGDALIYTSPLPTIPYYNQDRLPSYLIPYAPDTSLPEAEQQLQNVLGRHRRVWLVPAESDRWVSYEVEPWLDRHSARLDQTFFRIIHIGLYESPGAFYDTMTPQTARFADGLQLNGFRLAKGEATLIVEGEKAIPLTLMWSAEHTPGTAYTVFTHLVGPDGALWGQWDNPPVWGTYPTTEWKRGEIVFDQYLIPLEENAPPGEYHLLVGLYDPASGARLSVVDDQGGPIGDHILLDAELTVQ